MIQIPFRVTLFAGPFPSVDLLMSIQASQTFCRHDRLDYLKVIFKVYVLYSTLFKRNEVSRGLKIFNGEIQVLYFKSRFLWRYKS